MKGISDSVAICMVFQDMLPAVSLSSLCELPPGSTALQGTLAERTPPQIMELCDYSAGMLAEKALTPHHCFE